MTQKIESLIPRWGINPMFAYLGGIATWFTSHGLQFVMVPTLVIVTLGGTATQLAAAQVALHSPPRSLPTLQRRVLAGTALSVVLIQNR